MESLRILMGKVYDKRHSSAWEFPLEAALGSFEIPETLRIYDASLRSHVHWPTVVESYPATNDPVHEPESDQSDR